MIAARAVRMYAAVALPVAAVLMTVPRPSWRRCSRPSTARWPRC